MADRILTIGVRKYLVNQPRSKRARKAVKYIRDRVSHYTKIKPENIRIGYNLNALIFKKYSRTMVPVKLRVKIGTDTADVLPFEDLAVKKEETKAPAEAAKAAKQPLIKFKKKEDKPAQAPQPKALPAEQKPAQQKTEKN